jgi:hypothetical protein
VKGRFDMCHLKTGILVNHCQEGPVVATKINLVMSGLKDLHGPKDNHLNGMYKDQMEVIGIFLLMER